MITQKEILGAYVFLRTNNQSIPDEVLDFIKDAALEKLKAIPIEPPVSPMLAEEKTKRAFTDIHQILSNSKYGMNDCVARDKIYKVLNNLQQ